MSNSKQIADTDVEWATQSDVNTLTTGGDRRSRSALARFVHQRSARCDGPFVVVPGAEPYWPSAAGGTIFIEEVGDLSGDMQQKLMRLVERDQIDRRDLRIIGATGQNILERVESRAFDASLFYRLNVIHIVIP